MEISSPTHSRPLPSRPKPSKVANTSISSTTSTITSTKPRIRILLAPYMSPYVVPMNKVETWQLLLTLLEKLFGPSIANPNLRVTDTQGNAIHMHVWEDLLEAGMTIVVDTGSSSILTPVSSSSGPAQAIPSVYASPRLVQVAAPSGKQSASSPEISGKLFSFPGKGGEKAEKAAKLKAGKSSKNGKSPAIMETSGRKDGNPVIGFPVLISKTSMGENLIAISNGKAQAPSETVANRNEVLPVPEGTSEEIGEKQATTLNGAQPGNETDQKATPPSPQKPHDGDEEDKPSQDVVNAVNNPTTLVQPRDISTSQQTALDPEPILSTTEKNSRTVAARRKRSAAARVQEALMVLKTKYVSTSGPPASNAPPRALSSKNYVPPKTDSSNTTSPEDSPSSLKFSESSSGASSPGNVRTYTTFASGAISSQPPKSQRKPRRTKSFRAFFGYVEETPQPVVLRSCQGMTPIPQEPSSAKSVSSSSANGLGSKGSYQKSDKKSEYNSDDAAASGGRSRSGTSGTADTAVSESNAKVTSVTPTADKPLPKLPYKFSTFPAPTPPRSPLIKLPPRPLQAELLSTPPTPSNVIAMGSNKIIPFSELNRRLAKDTKFKKETKTPSRGGNVHRRNRSTTSQTSAASDPTTASSRPSTAITAAELAAISNYGLKSKIFSAGGATDKPTRAGSISKRAGRNIRKIASDDNISVTSAEARRSRVVEESKKFEFKRPKTANERRVGLGIDMLEIKSGRTIAIGVGP